ncbi:conserved hypothetical membrane protein [Formosa agariphila KMM 3901]|uniref:Conserved hypothetical membrane protein n=1 Tax=Formosa agariphila (strain DSM 15362 / KCTC 12365 / LMG 23005 / KMM 3901 / M-2Alg 35-1) TaxID=1347342 RepID=T2KRT7_FORAG|nr:DUF6168 family protein [Formosa agariphila]CDF81196.1 conserved hypothetical membrane protein [Formosa agariphila KMM 3901]
MIKRILIFTLCILLLFAVGFGLHSYLAPDGLTLELWQVYLYHAIASVIIYAALEAVASTVPNQAGYAYLVLMFLKLGLFMLIFNSTVFEEEQLSRVDKFGLVIPLFLFLTAEATAVAKLLNSK